MISMNRSISASQSRVLSTSNAPESFEYLPLFCTHHERNHDNVDLTTPLHASLDLSSLDHVSHDCTFDLLDPPSGYAASSIASSVSSK